ncbi:hypothetical protein CsatB_003253 [Cannabis sativa]|uniref:Uncharacterized protein n=1 Tax=Cannabis sativa TaxID=3483 RepID=A0A803R2U5_CANSA
MEMRERKIIIMESVASESRKKRGRSSLVTPPPRSRGGIKRKILFLLFKQLKLVTLQLLNHLHSE